MNKLFTLTAIAALVPTAAQAVRLGTDVDQSDYKDYIVRIETAEINGGTGSCGGLLIDGEYILTAAHCVGAAYTDTSTGGYNSIAYNWDVDNGATNDITVYQGIARDAEKHKATTYQVIDLISDDYAQAYTKHTAEIDYVKSLFSSADWSSQDSTVNEQWFYQLAYHDIALLKIADVISQKNHAKLTPIFDTDNNTFNVNSGDTFTFRGWGVDENGANVSTMQETELELAYHGDTINFWYNPATPTETSSLNECTDSSADSCKYYQKDYIRLDPTTVGATAASGDSGTPLVSNNDQVVAFTKNNAYDSTESVPYYNRFMNLSWYLPYIVDAIDKLAAPKTIEFTSDDSTTVAKFWAQNLSSTSKTLATSLSGTDSDKFSVSGCDSTTLDTTDACQITLSYTGSGEADASATLYLTDSTSAIPVTYTVATSTTPTESGGGSGGSFGVLSLFGLAGLTLLRKRA